MSFAAIGGLAADPEFLTRLASCIHVEHRDESDPFSNWIMTILAPASIYSPWIVTAPGFDEKYLSGGQEAITDQDLLAAVQAVTPAVKAAYPDHGGTA